VGSEGLLWLFAGFPLADWVGKGSNTVVMKSKDGKTGTGLVDESSSTKAKSVGFTLEQALWGPVAEGGASRVKSCTSQSPVWSVDQWVSITLAQALWGPVAVGGTGGVKPCATQSTVWSVNQWVSVTLLDSLGSWETPDGLSNEGGATVGMGGESLFWLFAGFPLAYWVGEGTNAIVMKSEDGKTGTGLVDESSGSQAEGVSVTLSKTLWGPVAVGDTGGVKPSAAQSEVWSKWVSSGQAQKR